MFGLVEAPPPAACPAMPVSMSLLGVNSLSDGASCWSANLTILMLVIATRSVSEAQFN